MKLKIEKMLIIILEFYFSISHCFKVAHIINDKILIFYFYDDENYFQN